MWRKFKWGISVECSRPMEQARARQEEPSNLLMRHPQDMSWKPVGELQEKYGMSKCVSIRPHDTWVILHTHGWSSLLMKWFEVTLISFTCYVHFCQRKMLSNCIVLWVTCMPYSGLGFKGSIITTANDHFLEASWGRRRGGVWKSRERKKIKERC